MAMMLYPSYPKSAFLIKTIVSPWCQGDKGRCIFAIIYTYYLRPTQQRLLLL